MSAGDFWKFVLAVVVALMIVNFLPVVFMALLAFLTPW